MFIIAEVGNNHNGDLALAKRLVDLALESGRRLRVKFQMRDLTSLYSNEGKTAEAGHDLGSQYTLDLLNRFQLSNDTLLEVFDYCVERGILPLSHTLGSALVSEHSKTTGWWATR